jgi:hypothetical protein
MFRKMYGLKMDYRGGILHTGELGDLHRSPRTVGILKSDMQFGWKNLLERGYLEDGWITLRRILRQQVVRMKDG